MSFFQPPSLPMPPGYPLPAVDANGMAVAAGDLVTILVIPHWLTHDLSREEAARVKGFEGASMRVCEIDGHGYLWIGTDGPWFPLRPDEVAVQKSEDRDKVRRKREVKGLPEP